MTVCYLDASAWVRRYLVEPGHDWVAQFWSARPEVGCSVLGPVEVMSAVVRRHRGAAVPPEATAAALQTIENHFAGMYRVEMDGEVCRLAREFARRRGLRGADCVHLASAFRLRRIVGEEVVTIASGVGP